MTLLESSHKDSDRFGNRKGLTILPVMAALALLATLMGVLARQVTYREKQWRSAVRQAQARHIAFSELSRIRFMTGKGEKPMTGTFRLEPGHYPGLKDPVEVHFDLENPETTSGIVIRVKIPADQTDGFASVTLQSPLSPQ